MTENETPLVDGDHVSQGELEDAISENIGDGTLSTAPETVAEDEGNSWIPTRKWLLFVVSGLLGVATTFVVTGSWDIEESLALIQLVGAAAASYLVPNVPTTGGVLHK
jgi:hypothetical protein